MKQEIKEKLLFCFTHYAVGLMFKDWLRDKPEGTGKKLLLAWRESIITTYAKGRQINKANLRLLDLLNAIAPEQFASSKVINKEFMAAFDEIVEIIEGMIGEASNSEAPKEDPPEGRQTP